jgi:hypothetical protein
MFEPQDLTMFVPFDNLQVVGKVRGEVGVGRMATSDLGGRPPDF